MTHVWGFLTPVPQENKAAYVESARKSWELFKEYGALSMHECWEAEVPEGKVTSFPMAVKREEGEAVVFSWMLWPDKETADRCGASFETDARWKEMMDMPFDGKRMIYGSFDPVFEA
ncbi:DUF1428 domain-containing protein [Alloyangia pacifica]|uniref:Uncharacterized conserved protein YbaA, DUF1428 family n=1 Tax=Alloyangia pacifica TaxID=311180 RepID=A0A1I6TIF0_9RHOB|nr:DUF1428 domain-containing protein [Alloyangia pacifica]SDH17092.1 Uncharacterized conserved protein YbaA, DUF1428 family [Alloyangia pacifica]SFS88993.1 Uncharacterized conserved protein YbaA, DUF1428 family [Alloyangia pacifica]